MRLYLFGIIALLMVNLGMPVDESGPAPPLNSKSESSFTAVTPEIADPPYPSPAAVNDDSDFSTIQPFSQLLNANPRAIMNAIDRDVSDRWPAVVDAQQQQFQRHGRHLQLLNSHSQRPANGAADLPDRLWSRPTYQNETWLSTDILNPLQGVPYMARLDAYESPRGPGFVLVVEVVLEGAVHTRSWQYGPEQNFTHGWITESGE